MLRTATSATFAGEALHVIPPIILPFSDDYLNSGEAPIYFESPGTVLVRVGPCAASLFTGDRIPLDGRHYICAGKIILRNGKQLRAQFEINTHTFDYLDRDSVYVRFGDTWYSINGVELWDKLGLAREDQLPYRWLPDRRLDMEDEGPYQMYYHSPLDTGSLHDSPSSKAEP